MPVFTKQYHHFIPQFILKQFAYTESPTKSSGNGDGLLNLFDLQTGQFITEEVKRSCGMYNLYYMENDPEHMRIEDLFSGIESQTSQIFSKIRNAAKEKLDHVNILEKDIHNLFKFMILSLRRSKQYRDEMQNPYRENDFMFQRLFKASRKEGRSSDPGEVWLEQILYLLKATHEELLADAEHPGDSTSKASARTYKHFVENYALQIWHAADGYEFFLNESLCDFEGDTQSFLGAEITEHGPQLMLMTTDDMIHVILPISPTLAVVFCDESRCWESPFADTIIRHDKTYPQNSLLAKAPHKDIVTGQVPAKRKGRKRWPATVDWRVSIGKLSQQHHRVIASYSLSHARSIVVLNSRALFENTRKELEVFAKQREEVWTRQGIRYGHMSGQQPTHETTELSPERLNRMVDSHISALDEVLHITRVTQEIPPRSKENSCKFWFAFKAILSLVAAKAESPETMPIMHPAMLAAFESLYPPKQPEHKDLFIMDFVGFLDCGMGEATFAQLTSEIEQTISEWITKVSFLAPELDRYEKLLGIVLGSMTPKVDGTEQSYPPAEDLHRQPCFKAIFGAAQTFDILRWMFEERQDILATFVQRYAVSLKDAQPNLIRMRARR
ncbi:hypothetical protein DTO027I6_10122 [Penicillium roqueforti]|nr:hypothetical protein CBS147337_10159 [Penicillium roqueforti]KAI3182684.1 hypothetical protein DTO027I6_10122 [Penicillium roqueforti]KAJ5043553.1 hypothetical protein NUH16_000342 [Penicillium rubens]